MKSVGVVEAEDGALREKQEKVWGEFLAWSAERHDLHFAPSTSLAQMPDIQPESVAKLRSHLGAYNFWSAFRRALMRDWTE